MKTKLKLLVMCIMVVAFAITGCTKEVNDVNQTNEEVIEGSLFPREYKDGLGYNVRIDREIERIISVAPSHTEILFALGLEEKIVAVSDFCDYPVEALDKEKVGGYQTFNIEKMIELDPDIVFIFGKGDEEAIKQLEAVDIAIARYEPESIQEVLDTIDSIASITGSEERGLELIEDMEQRRDTIIEKVQNLEVVPVFYEVWHEPLMAAGKGSYIDELITLAGGENISRDAEGAYPIFSVEALVEKDPEVYIKPAEHGGAFFALTEEDKAIIINEIVSRPGYGDITAIKEGNIVLLEPNILSRPGIRIVEALELVAEAIHPEIF